MRFPIFSDLPRRTAPVHLALTVAGGGFTDLVIDTIFGADLRLVGALNAEPKLEGFDAKCAACKSAASRQEIHDFP